mgnify:CR=1 FL=1
MPDPNTMDIHEATKLMFRDTLLWPKLILPIKNYNIKSSAAEPFADNGVMVNTTGNECEVILGCNIWDSSSLKKKPIKYSVEKLIADGWVVD